MSYQLGLMRLNKCLLTWLTRPHGFANETCFAVQLAKWNWHQAKENLELQKVATWYQVKTKLHKPKQGKSTNVFKSADRDVWSKETNKNGNVKNMSDRIFFFCLFFLWLIILQIKTDLSQIYPCFCPDVYYLQHVSVSLCMCVVLQVQCFHVYQHEVDQF